MASEDVAALYHPDDTVGLPLVVVVPVTVDDLDGFVAFLVMARQNAVIHDTHFCFVADAAIAGQLNTELRSVVVDVAVWSVVSASPGLEHAMALSEIAGRHAGRDMVLVAPKAELPFAWDARLRKAAYAEARIAVAMAMCDVAPMFALLMEPPPDNTALDSVLVDRTAFAMGNRSYYEVPRAHSICTYFRRDAIDTLSDAHGTGPQDNDAIQLDSLIKGLRALGWSCVLCDYLYVGVKHGITDTCAANDVEETAFRQNHPLGSLRRSVAAAIHLGIANVSTPGLDSRPVHLHIMHYWGGGLDKWVRDFGRADPSRINLVFSSFRIGETGGQRLVLYSDPVDPNPIRVWDIAQPIRSTLSRSIEYRRILEQIIREFEVEAIIVSSLIGHTLDAVSQPLKTIVVCHDFYPVCQAINPQFGKTCERCTLEDLRLCAQSNPLNNIFVDQGSDEWHAMRSLYVERLLQNKVEMVVPSPSVENTLKRLSPRMQGLRFHLISHGIDTMGDPLPVASRTATEPLRLVVLGRLSLHKGAGLLKAAADDLRAFAQITLVGCGGNGVKLAQACGWDYIEKYESADLPAILQRLAPHAGMLTSVIPETFSYTLSELNCLGVPTLATALGSFNDRIVDGESGFLFQPTKESLVALVRRLHERPQLLTEIAEKLRSNSLHRNIADMVSDYRVLIPSAPRPLARFRVGIGVQSGLTEPYRQLSEAYGHLTGAYDQTRMAYEVTRAERDDLAGLRGLCDEWTNEFDAVNLKKRWWRIRRALNLMEDFREKLGNFRKTASKIQESSTGKSHGPSDEKQEISL